MAAFHTRLQKTHDHRFRCLVRSVRDPNTAAELGAPRSTALGWLHGKYRPVVTAEVLDMDRARLQAQVLKLQRRVNVLGAIIGLLATLMRALHVWLDNTLLFTVHLATRRVHVAGIAPNSDGTFMLQVARQRTDELDGPLRAFRYLIMDREDKFAAHLRKL